LHAYHRHLTYYVSNPYSSQPHRPSFPTRRSSALFYLSRDMAAEAKAVLDVTIADSPPNAEDPTPLVLRAAANILMGRPEQGLKRSEEHTSDSSHQIISYAVFCLRIKSNKHLSKAM